MFDDKTEEITDLSFEGGITLDFKLKEWGTNDKSILAKLCNEIDRKYLSNRIPYPYTEVEKKSDVFCKDAEIGYFLSSDKWSKGIMTKAVSEITKIAFDKLDIIRITGIVYKPNIASQRVLEKNDFVLEGIKKNAVFKNGNIYDMFIYGKYI